MSLKSLAQELIVLDPSAQHSMQGSMELVPLEVHESPQEFHEHEGHENGDDLNVELNDDLHVQEPGEVAIVIDNLPGAPDGPDPISPDEKLEVSEHDKAEDDDNESKQSKKPEKWDWASKGASGFVVWIKERLAGIPQHSGYDSAGLERAISYLEKLDAEISKAMRMDLDGDLDANKVEEVRSKIDDGINRLHDRLEKVKKSKKRIKKKADSDNILVKEGQKIAGVQGVYIMAPLLASRIARVCINGTISAGHDIEDLYDRQVKFYKLNVREQAEVMQLMADMGYPIRQDRGFMPDQDVDPTSSDNMDWAANYKG